MKKFYTLVSTSADEGGYAILLDGKPVKTAMKNALRAPTQGLADAIVQEWSAQSDEIIPDTMPLTQILSTRIDRVESERPEMQRLILKYLNTDLLCYRADHPPELAEKQSASWDPVLKMFEDRFGFALETTTGLSALQHPAEVHEAVREYVEACGADHFTVLQIVTAAAGSLILGIAFLEGDINQNQVFEAARIEESYKADLYDEEKYGPDPAQEKKDKAFKDDLDAAQRYLALIG